LLIKNLKIIFVPGTIFKKLFPGKSYILGLDFWMRVR